MNTTQPIKSYAEVQKLKNYYWERKEYRNYLFVTVCLNTALRVCDVLALKWEDVIDRTENRVKTHIYLRETKTGKATAIKINESIKSAIALFLKEKGAEGEYIFANRDGSPLSRTTAFNIVKRGGSAIGLRLSPHSLRKTFGYHAVKNGTPPAVLMQIYNHSSYEITKRYLGIAQDDKDNVFMSVAL